MLTFHDLHAVLVCLNSKCLSYELGNAPLTYVLRNRLLTCPDSPPYPWVWQSVVFHYATRGTTSSPSLWGRIRKCFVRFFARPSPPAAGGPANPNHALVVSLSSCLFVTRSNGLRISTHCSDSSGQWQLEGAHQGQGPSSNLGGPSRGDLSRTSRGLLSRWR